MKSSSLIRLRFIYMGDALTGGELSGSAAGAVSVWAAAGVGSALDLDGAEAVGSSVADAGDCGKEAFVRRTLDWERKRVGGRP